MYLYSVDIDSSAANQRIFKEQYDPAVNSWTTSAYCNPASGPTVAEYHTMVKEGIKLFHYVCFECTNLFVFFIIVLILRTVMQNVVKGKILQ